MPKVKQITDTTGQYVSYVFHCPACKRHHSCYVERPDKRRPCWSFNGDLEKPTFTPSIVSLYGRDDEINVCHSFVCDGRIEFLSDCTHSLAGQTVDLPEVEESANVG